VAANNGGTPLTHFGKQVRKERLARGWSLRELASRSGLAAPYLSQIENGRRPPTEKVALACDDVFPERRGWFAEYYEESRSWMPAGFRNWGEYEDRAAELRVWSPGIIDGLAQTADYAQAMLSVHPGVTAEVVRTRLRGRLDRQSHLLREDGPAVVLLVDMAALYRGVGSAEVMAGQCARLAEVAQLDAVTLQVVPPVTIPLATASVMIASEAAYTENALNGSVYTDDETVTRLRRLFDSVRAEARPASESLAIIRRAERQWRPTSAHRHTQAATAASALRLPAPSA
jgi:transcriptional regulator with XRE-family HTH domain